MRTLPIHAAHHRLAYNGVTETYQDLSKDTVWPGQWEETKRFVETCDVCQRIKQSTQQPTGTAQMIQVPEKPFQSISMDIIGPFPPSQGFEYVTPATLVYTWIIATCLKGGTNLRNSREGALAPGATPPALARGAAAKESVP